MCVTEREREREAVCVCVCGERERLTVVISHGWGLVVAGVMVGMVVSWRRRKVARSIVDGAS